MNYISTIHFSLVEHVGCFNFLAIVNRAAMSMAKQGSVDKDVEPFEHMPRSSRAVSSNRFILAFLRLLHTGFQSGSTDLQSQEW